MIGLAADFLTGVILLDAFQHLTGKLVVLRIVCQRLDVVSVFEEIHPSLMKCIHPSVAVNDFQRITGSFGLVHACLPRSLVQLPEPEVHITFGQNGTRTRKRSAE